MLTRAQVVLCICVAVVALQYTASKFNNVWLKPATYLDKIATFCVNVWDGFGRLVAHLCSYLTYLNFKELYQAFADLFSPLWRMVSAPMYFAAGYASVVKNYVMDDQFLTYFGTLLLIIASCLLIKRYWPATWSVAIYMWWNNLHPFWQLCIMLDMVAFSIGVIYFYPGVLIWIH